MALKGQGQIYFPVRKSLNARVHSKQNPAAVFDACVDLLRRRAPLQSLPPSNPFDKLPIEINQRIASFISDDGSLCNFAQSCRPAHSAIYADKDAFWRRQFLSAYEPPSGSNFTNTEYRDEYQKRAAVLQRGKRVTFILGQERDELTCLVLLRDLLIDALTPQPTTSNCHEPYEPLNLKHIREFVQATNLLQIVCQPVSAAANRRAVAKGKVAMPHRLLQTVQILLAPAMLSLDPHIADCHHDYQLSQQVTFGASPLFPMFDRLNCGRINMEYVLHNLNFWKLHLAHPQEMTLCPAFQTLAESERPKFWSLPLQHQIAQFGKHWKGTYSFIDNHRDLHRVRQGLDEDETVQEVFPGEGHADTDVFQYLQLEFAEVTEKTWPPMFEEHMPVFSAKKFSGVQTRSQERLSMGEGMGEPVHIRIVGEGVDQQEHFLASGFLMTLPSQCGVRGFSRIVLMKYWEENGVIDGESLWAYEGVVFPGGQIMLGRWWNPNEGGVGPQMYSGPFILWCTDV